MVAARVADLGDDDTPISEFFLLGHPADNPERYASDKHVVAHLIDHVDCIDEQASGVKWIGEGELRRIFRLRTLVIDSARVPEDRKLFFPRYHNQSPILRRSFAEAMKQEGFSGLHIEEISDHGRESRRAHRAALL